jgi:hypothetical protein
MLEIFNGSRTPTDAFLKFQVSVELLQRIVSDGSAVAEFENEIREKHSYLSFQHPDRISEAVRLFHPDPIWPEIGNRLSVPASNIKTKLKLIVERRNKIAHEADMDPSYPGSRWPITKADAINTVTFIENICETIDLIVT